MAAVSLACSIFVGGPTYPEVFIPISSEATHNLTEQILTASASSDQTGKLTLQFNESQITSYLRQLLETQTDPFITDPQVVLREDEMIIFGKVRSGIFKANVSITRQVNVDQNGEAKVTISHSESGPLPSPQELNDAASALLGELFTGTTDLPPLASGFKESVSLKE